ncbi:MAG: hypothetical protein AABX23_03100 [Nanoarchaeota archaeon]
MPDMQKLMQTKERILEIIKERGPELPVRVASTISQNNIFTAAFMSELVGEQKLKLSNMRVGGSPLYYISGQEEQLQKYTEYLNHKEKEAFKLLKQNEILQDSEQEPAIRVALRSIKDFAIPVKIIDNSQEKIFWKIHTLSNDKTKELIEKAITPIKHEIKQEIKEEKTLIKEELKQIEKSESIKLEQQVKEIKNKEANSDFLDKIKKVMSEKEYEITKEILTKKKEFTAKIRLNTHLGQQELYMVAKDKKKITLDDIVSTLQKAQAEKMPALIISPGEVDKKALDYYKEWSNLIKHQKLEI